MGEKPAYDLKLYLEKLKAEGLDLAEDAAAKVLKCTFSWLRESAEKSDNKIDDMVAPLLVPVEKYVLTQIDKIDGEAG